KSGIAWVLLGAALAGAVGFALISSPAPKDAITPTPPTNPGAPMPPLPATGEELEGTGGSAAMGDNPHEGVQDTTLVGTVREHVDVSQYTYLRLASDAGETWAAVYRAPVKDGTTVTVERAIPLTHFHSAELKRDFDEIWFGVLPGYDTAPPAPGAPSAMAAKNAPAASASSPAAKAPANALPIATLARDASKLEGTRVTVAGRVVKENDGILGRNWIHLQDGSGSAGDGTNDVLVTTDGTAKVGDSIVASGTVRTNQDFGSGYAYKFMLEQASVRIP
ncbi:MAG TPA: hypothetical protein VGI39_04645, partial [Polyangiaceae bacterium]